MCLLMNPTGSQQECRRVVRCMVVVNDAHDPLALAPQAGALPSIRHKTKPEMRRPVCLVLTF